MMPVSRRPHHVIRILTHPRRAVACAVGLALVSGAALWLLAACTNAGFWGFVVAVLVPAVLFSLTWQLANWVA